MPTFDTRFWNISSLKTISCGSYMKFGANGSTGTVSISFCISCEKSFWKRTTGSISFGNNLLVACNTWHFPWSNWWNIVAVLEISVPTHSEVFSLRLGLISISSLFVPSLEKMNMCYLTRNSLFCLLLLPILNAYHLVVSAQQTFLVRIHKAFKCHLSEQYAAVIAQCTLTTQYA